jgi:glutamine amidotransferase
LGQLPGKVEMLDAPTLPHIGWNTVQAARGSKLFAGVEHERFYFVHSYGVRNWELEAIGSFIPPKVTWAEYGTPFVAACEVGPLSATQFHPEKSGEAGIQLLTNWVATL